MATATVICPKCDQPVGTYPFDDRTSRRNQLEGLVMVPHTSRSGERCDGSNAAAEGK